MDLRPHSRLNIFVSPRRIQLWVWLLLPFLVARACLPAGFMAQAVAGRLQLVFCSAGYSQHSVTADADNAAGHAQGQSHDKSQNDFSCPFGQSVSAPLLSFNGSELIEFIADAEMLSPAESPYYAAGPPRFISTRGPPAHA